MNTYLIASGIASWKFDWLLLWSGATVVFLIAGLAGYGLFRRASAPDQASISGALVSMCSDIACIHCFS